MCKAISKAVELLKEFVPTKVRRASIGPYRVENDHPKLSERRGLLEHSPRGVSRDLIRGRDPPQLAGRGQANPSFHQRWAAPESPDSSDNYAVTAFSSN